MESLYRKYRPLTFDSVVGQQHIVSTLEHAITEGRLSHAYLFCGPRGTGKTTMARILAKALLCRNAEAARAEGASGCMPDGTCEECELIAEGSHPGCLRARCRKPYRRGQRARGDHQLRQLCPGARQVQDLYHRRGSHAHDGGVQRAAQDA